MAVSMGVKIACMMVVCMVVTAPFGEAITCSTVMTNVLPCVTYLTKGGAVSEACCNGVKSLNSQAQTTGDRQTVCGCLKTASSSFKVVGSYAASLPGKCGVSINIKISPSTDCSKVN